MYHLVIYHLFIYYLFIYYLFIYHLSFTIYLSLTSTIIGSWSE